MYVLKQRVHPTWMLTVMCAGLLVGIALARYVGPITWATAIAGSIAIIFSFWHCRVWMFSIAISGTVLLGLWRGGLEVQSLTAHTYTVGARVTVTGRIAEDPSIKGGKQALSLDSVHAGATQLGGKLYVTVNENPQLRRDDEVTVKGAITEGYGNYAATIYLAEVKSVNRPHNVFLDVRDTLGTALRTVLQEPMASLGIGFLVGQRSELPSDFNDALKVAGLTHIVVASGYNLTILVRLARRIFEKVSRYQAVLWSVVMILGFMAITGWSASMTRAGLVAALSLWAWYYGRKFHPVTLLLIAASVTAGIYPPYAWGDVGWMLSFAAFAGVIILAPLLQAYFYGTRTPHFAARTVIETASAQLATLPIMLGIFGQFSVIALLSNVLILPLVPIAMLLTFAAGIAQIVVPAIGAIVAWPAGVLLNYMVMVVNWTASFPWAQWKWQMPWWVVCITYGIIIAYMVYLRRATGYNLRQVNIVE